MKPISGYEGFYTIDESGNVYSAINNIIRKPSNHRQGYKLIMLFKDGKKKCHLVHRLVAKTFIPNSDNKATVNHIDGDKKNNHISNLEWATQTENGNHAIRTGLRIMPVGENHHHSILTVELIEKIKAKYVKGVYGYKCLEKEFGIKWCTIAAVLTERNWKHLKLA